MSIPPGPWRFKLAATVIPAVPPPTIKTLWCVVPAIMALPSNWPARCGLGHSLAKHRIIILNPMSIAVQHAHEGRRFFAPAQVTAASRSDLVIGQALVHLQGRHQPARPADDPRRDTCDRGAGRNVMQDDTARADLGVATDLNIAEHFCPSAEQHAVAHFRMPVATLLASAAERYFMQD